jgi:hypothetical protein
MSAHHSRCCRRDLGHYTKTFGVWTFHDCVGISGPFTIEAESQTEAFAAAWAFLDLDDNGLTR